MKKNQQGFTLFEVLISMFIAGVAVLGLVMLELNILRSSQSSFNYTLATIHANTFVDRIWRNLCYLEKSSNSVAKNQRYQANYNTWKSSVINQSAHAVMVTKTSEASGTLPVFALNDAITVKWADKNFDTDVENDKVTLTVSYPDFTGDCN